MIIVITGPQGSGKTAAARQIEKSAWPLNGVVFDEIPRRRPTGPLPSLTIFTMQDSAEPPKWLLGRLDTVFLPVKIFAGKMVDSVPAEVPEWFSQLPQVFSPEQAIKAGGAAKWSPHMVLRFLNPEDEKQRLAKPSGFAKYEKI